MDKRVIFAIVIAAAIAVIGVIVVLKYASQPSALDEKVNELNSKGYNVEYCLKSFVDLRSERIEQALNVANAVAALTITKKGAQDGQPSLEKTASFLSKHGISIDPILRTFRKGKRRKRKRRSG